MTKRGKYNRTKKITKRISKSAKQFWDSMDKAKRKAYVKGRALKRKLTLKKKRKRKK